MDRRQELQALLEGLLGSRNVYFQPPATLQMQYPAIVYQRDGADTLHADNRKYRRHVAYQVTYIDRNPDSNVVEKLSDLPMCSQSTYFVVGNLNHDIFRLYF